MNPQRILEFRRKVLTWYRTHKADLPWRHTRDPYNILVSEVMLQQTQVDRVRQKWPEFLRQFPTLQSLSVSPVSSVILAWSGMGYNRRALYLQKTAQAVVGRFGGEFPQTLGQLQTLPGIGEYTARALLVFAFGRAYIAPDVNVLRILGRSFGKEVKIRRDEDMTRHLIAIGDNIVTPKNAYDLNQALMDMGRTACRAKHSQSLSCPLHDHPSLRDEFVPQRRTQGEPMFAGVPRRIWRGRIIELVRTQKKATSEQIIYQLGIQVDDDAREWLHNVFKQLGQDGLIRFASGMVTLP
ncbi:A/G-specific adenine glycosylase [Candidatus Uhrbacteria bacterium]|nr:A/G-specific adenine glycosylase [Candidatus Uhrbacteria bacterium]